MSGSGGSDNIRGVALQLAVACDAALQMAADSELTELRVEGLEDIADLELWAGDRLVRITQVKSRVGHRALGPAELAELARRFTVVEHPADAYEIVTDTIVSRAGHEAILAPAAMLRAGEEPSADARRRLAGLGLGTADDVLARLSVVPRFGDPEYQLSRHRDRVLRALAGTGASAAQVLAAVDRLFAEVLVRAGHQDAGRRLIAAEEVRAILGVDASRGTEPRDVVGRVSPLVDLPVRDERLLKRSELLARVGAGFSAGGSVQILTGFPGCGKTELAIRVAHDVADRYSLVWWVSAKEASTVADGLRRLLLSAGDAAAEQADERDVLRRAVGTLQARAPWLLVLDDAPSPTFVRDLGLPRDGQVLITSRHPGWAGFGVVHEVGVFTETESVATLLAHRPEDEAADALSLAQALGYLPLALTQAGAYLVLSGRSFVDFERLLRERLDVLDVEEAVELAEGRYERSVVATLDLLLGALPAGPVTALAGLLAQLGPAPIPRWLLTETAASAPDTLGQTLADDRALDGAVSALHRSAVIRASPDGLLMHALTARAARERLASGAAEAMRAGAVRMLAAAFPSNALDTSGWARSSALLAHAHAVLDAPGALDDDDGAWLAVTVCSVDHIQGRLAEAEDRARRALRGAAARADPRLRSQLLHIVGRVGLKNGRIHESVAPLVEALGELEALGDRETLDYVTIEVTLGALLSVLEDDDAEPRLQHALEVQRRELEPDDPRIARTLIEIGGDRHGHGDFRGAEVFTRQALQIVDRPEATAGVDLARGLSNLAGILSDLPEHRDEALTLAERALAVIREVYGDQHPEVAYPLTTIADTVAADDLERAIGLLLEALGLRTAAFGPRHEQVGYTLGHLGSVLLASGDASRALPWLEQAHELLLDLFGEEHTEVASAAFDLAQAYAALGRSDEARDMALGLLPVIRDAWGPHHEHVQVVERFTEQVDAGSSP